MLSFRKFLIESYLILENKRQDFINRFLKIHSDHPLVQDNPEMAGSLIGHSLSFGQNADEHTYLTRQFLDGTYKPGEDDPTIQMTLSKWRRGKQQGLVRGSLKDHSHSSVSALFRDIPELSKSSSKAVRAGEELDKYHIGQIEHPEHGTLDVYHVHHSDIPADYDADPRLPVEEEFKKINSALRKSCSGGDYSWCVLPQKTKLADGRIISDTGAKMIKHYSKGSGIFFYANEDGKIVLSHGYKDRGVVLPDNDVVDIEQQKQVIGETNKLLSGAKKFQHNVANFDKLPEDKQMQTVKDPSFGSDPSHIFSALGSPHESVQRAAAEHPNFGSDPHHIFSALVSPHESVQRAAIEHPDFGSDPYHIEYAFKSPHESVRTAAIEHPSFGSDSFHISSAVLSPHESVARAAVEHPRFGSGLNGLSHISTALNSPHKSVQRAAAEHPRFGSYPEHITYALKSGYEPLQRAAAEHPNFGSDPEHIYVALNSPHESVQRAAIEYPSFGSGPYDIDVALRSRYEPVARAAIEHPSFGSSKNHITDALNSRHESIARAAIEHPSFGSDPYHINVALRSRHESVKNIAKSLRIPKL